jgi:hypothetical protein
MVRVLRTALLWASLKLNMGILTAYDDDEPAMVKAFLDNVRTQSINAAVAGLVDQYATDSRDAMRSARDVRNHLIHSNAIRQDLSGAVNDLQSITRRVIAGMIRDWIGAHPAPTRP